MKDLNRTVNNRSWMLIIGSLFVAGGIVYKLAATVFWEGNEYRKLAGKFTVKTFKVKAARGNIYSEDNRILAVTVPLYTVHFDPMVIRSDRDYYKNLNGLASGLSRILGGDYTYWKDKLTRARKNKRRYVFIAKNVSFRDFEKIKKLPLFKRGRFKGGLIYEVKPQRQYPFGNMLKRTIGASTPHSKYGIEGAYDKVLRGTDGERLKQKINAKAWKPINDFNEKEPENGLDLVTTVNMQMQDIAHQTLRKQLEKFKADHGILVLMEVQTGAVKAIVNLKRTRSGQYKEYLNYAINENYEPGSLFKTFTFLALLEDGKVDTSHTVELHSSRWKYYDRYISDAHTFQYKKLNLTEAFAQSSNIVTVQLTDQFYKNNPSEFTDRLITGFGLAEKLDLKIKGASPPKIPVPGTDTWKAYKLGMMSFGYGVEMTPLHILTFYNGIANNGKVVKPYFVKEIRRKNQTVKSFGPEVLNASMASEENIKKIKTMMRKVVTEGTASNINSPYVAIAGKTGTTQTDYWTDNIQYIASFAGFFPYENPKYSMIVVIHKPDKSVGYYGNVVAGKVFQEVAEQVYGITPKKLIVKAE